MSYIIFTNDDRAGKSGTKTINDMKNPDSEVYSAIYEKLTENDVNSGLSEMRIKCIAENMVEYCLKTGDTYNKDEDFYGYPGRTMGALGDRLMNGILGFHSSTWDDFKYWDNEIYNHVKKRFINITEELDWSEILSSEKAVPVIQSLFNEFMDICVKCCRNSARNFTNYPVGEYCCACNYKDNCLQSIIYEQKKSLISGKYYPVHQWLTNIYDFSALDVDAKDKSQQIFFNLYNTHFISLCRKNNARVLASDDFEMNGQKIEEKIQSYFDCYDKELGEDGRILFEQMVKSIHEMK